MTGLPSAVVQKGSTTMLKPVKRFQPMPGAPSSVLAPSSDMLNLPLRWLQLMVEILYHSLVPWKGEKQAVGRPL